MRLLSKDGDAFILEVDADELHILCVSLSQSLLHARAKGDDEIIIRLDAPRGEVVALLIVF